MENITIENLHILWLASLKLLSIWWPFIIFAGVMAFRLYRFERSLDQISCEEDA